MILALAALTSSATLWRSYEEVFDLARDSGSLLAATNGGLLRDGKPVFSPSGLREIASVKPLILRLSNGRLVRQDGAGWLPAEPANRVRSLDSGLMLDENSVAPWPVAPPAHPYAAIRFGPHVYAGTSDGLYRLEDGTWVRETVPRDLPVSRPNGIALVGNEYVVGGLGGLYIGRPGAWRQVREDAIRQISSLGNEVWVVHGSGALDKVEPLEDRLIPDALAGNSRRPWTSCVAKLDDGLIFGSLEGWAERSKSEHFPTPLKGDVVTAAAGRNGIRWIGTQKSGLFRFDGKTVRNWNPGNGLPDTWVTSLLRTRAGLLVGTAHCGIFRVVGDAITPVPSPTQRVTGLALWQKRPVVGGMDGAWVSNGTTWSPLATGGEETTSITPLSGQLAVTTASGVFFIRL